MVEFLAKCNERSDSSAEPTLTPQFSRLSLTDVATIAANSAVLVLTVDLGLLLHCLSSRLNVASLNHV